MKQKCTKDLVMHLLLGRFASEDGTTTELETLFNAELNALDIDVPENVLRAIETIGTGPNMQRFMNWLMPDAPFDNLQAQIDVLAGFIAPANVIDVGSNAAYTSIADAADSIVDSAVNKRYVIRVAPGIYTERQINLPSYVFIEGTNIDAVIVQPDAVNHHVVGLSGRSGVNNLTIRNSGTGFAGIYSNNVGNFALCNKISIQNCDIGVWHQSNTTDSFLFLEYVDFTDCITNAIYIAKLGSAISEMFLENMYVESTFSNPANTILITGGATLRCIVMQMLGIGATGDAIKVTDGGRLILSSTRIRGYNRGIYADNVGTNPRIELSDVGFGAQDGTPNNYNIVIDSSTASGTFFGYSDYNKIIINSSSSFFVANKDRNTITVAKSGGDFETIKEAVDYITDASSNNRYIIYVGPGVFVEDTITLKDFVSIYADVLKGTSIQLKTSPTENVLIKANGYSTISNVLLSGLGSVAGTTLIKYTGNQLRLSDCRFTNADIAIDASGVSGSSASYTNRLTIQNSCLARGGDVGLLLKLSDDGVHDVETIVNGFTCVDAIVPLNNIAEIGVVTVPDRGIFTKAWFNGCTFVGGGGTTGGTGINIGDGALVHIAACSIADFDVGLRVQNLGEPPHVSVSGGEISGSATSDIIYEHPLATGAVATDCDITKVSIAGNTVNVLLQDDSTGAVVMPGDLYQGAVFNEVTNVTETITKEPTLGRTNGGETTITGSSPPSIHVAAGSGYLMVGTDPDLNVKYVEWDDTDIILDANTNKNVYCDENGIIQITDSIVDIYTTVFLARAVTDSDEVVMLVDTYRDAVTAGTKYDRIFRLYLGAIYRSGSIVTAAATPQELLVTSGDYAFSTRVFRPSGSSMGTSGSLSPIEFTKWYPDPNMVGGTGDVVHKFVISSPTTIVPNDQYYEGGSTDDLVNLSPGSYVKHAFYTYGDGDHERYFLVYGQEEFIDLAAAQAGGLPPTPGPLSISAVLIASIIMQQGDTAIQEITDLRPTLVSRVSAVASTAEHGNLSGLGDDDHLQYLLVNGSRAMSGNLNMGTNSITNVGTVDGVDVSAHQARHIPGGADALPVDAPTTNLKPSVTNTAGVVAKFSRSDHAHTLGHVPVTAGAYQAEPALTDNGDGTIDISACDFLLYSTADFTGDLLKYNLSAATFMLTDDTLCYVVADYNAGGAGAPGYKLIANVELITESDVVPVYTCYLHTEDSTPIVHYMSWDRMADGMTNKLHQRLVKTERFSRESGLVLGEVSPNRYVTVTAGKFWYGGVRVSADAFNSGALSPNGLWHFWYHGGSGGWESDINTTQYNNIQYDDGASLVTLTNNYYTINWIYRGIEAVDHGHYFLGTQEYGTISEAQEAQVPADIPPMVRATAVLVGRIIIQKNQNTASGATGLIESAFAVTFKAIPVNDHNLLYNIQGGTTDEYYHLTAAQNTALTTGVDASALHTHASITGILPVANGGTNSSTALNNNRVMVSSAGAIIESTAITASRALVSDANGIPVASATTATEAGYLSGLVPTANRLIIGNTTGIIAASAITASRALVSDANGIPVASATTATELGYVNGVTSAIQTQLNARTIAVETSTTATTSLTTTAGQIVIVQVKGDLLHAGAGAHTVTLSYNAVTKDTIVCTQGNNNREGIFLQYTETPGAATANLVLATTAGSLGNIRYIITKIG